MVHQEGRSVARLWLYGIGMLGPALYFARRYPLLGNTGQVVDLGILSDYDRSEFRAFVAAIMTLFALYALALRECQRLPSERALPAVFGIGVTLASTMATMYPVTATDLFLYAARSRLFTAHGANPNVALPQDFPADPWRPLVSDEWASSASPYGPLWNLLAAPVTLLAGDRLAVALVGFKLLALLCLLMGGWGIARALAATPGAQPAAGALCYLWNPLVLWEGVGNGHNDVVMLLPMLLAFRAWATGRDVLVIPLLVVAVAIKYTPVVLIPLAAIAAWRRAGGGPARFRLVAGSALLSAVVSGIALAPFYDPGALRTSLAHQGDIVLTSPVAAAAIELQGRVPRGVTEAWGKRLGAGVLLATLAGGAGAVWRRPARLPRAAYETLAILLLTATWSFRGWYLIWLVGLAALLPPGWPALRAGAWAAGAMAAYGFFIWVWGWRGLTFDQAQTRGVVLMFAPVVLATLAEVGGRIVAAVSSRSSRASGRGGLRRAPLVDEP